MKKNILFVIDSLHCAGAEKSLVTLLRLLDYTKYSVDLQLFGYGGEFDKLVPKEVNFLSPLEYTIFSGLSIKDSILYSVKKLNFKMLTSRMKYSISLRKNERDCACQARLFWQSTRKVIKNNAEEYDIAIAYAQAIPTFYVAEKIKAKEKYTWINVSYRLNENERKFQKQYYDKYNNIVAVSESTKNIFLETFPNYRDKMMVIKDINDPNFICKMAEMGKDYEDNFNGIRLLTIGRLSNQKGYNMALEACKKLKEKGIDFRWYALGKGPLKEDIENYIKENGLEDNFILLGVTDNPYPFIKNCDIYVQTSKFEGFGIAIAEARILNKPIVTTRFDAVFTQMIHEKNGLVVDMNSDAICNGILEFINNKQLKEDVVHYLKAEKKGNLEELEKFYELIQ